MRPFVYIPLFVLAATLAFSQEIDNALGPRRTELTIFDEIEDRAERDAFRAAWDAKEPRTKRDRADAFVERFPRSIVCRGPTSSPRAPAPTWVITLRRSTARAAAAAPAAGESVSARHDG